MNDMNKFVLDDSMYQGYIKLWRKVRDWAFFQKPLALALWVTLLCEANHRPTRKFFKGKIIVIEPGQLLTGRKYLAEMVGISESSVEKYLKQFEEEQQITQQTSSKSRLITIKNWPQYQEGHTAEQTTCYTTKRQQKDNKKTHRIMIRMIRMVRMVRKNNIYVKLCMISISQLSKGILPSISLVPTEEPRS